MTYGKKGGSLYGKNGFLMGPGTVRSVKVVVKDRRGRVISDTQIGLMPEKKAEKVVSKLKKQGRDKVTAEIEVGQPTVG